MRPRTIFSECRTYRYSLWREWDRSAGHVLFIALNPSTADETADDPTIRRCVGFARDWGYGGVCVANLFAFRATRPADLKRAVDPVGPDNDRILRRLARRADIVVAAWGVHGRHRARDRAVLDQLTDLHCLDLTKAGSPAHPLYQPKSRSPKPFPAVRASATGTREVIG